jgi:hypothetical protein
VRILVSSFMIRSTTVHSFTTSIRPMVAQTMQVGDKGIHLPSQGLTVKGRVHEKGTAICSGVQDVTRVLIWTIIMARLLRSIGSQWAGPA